MIRLLAGEEFKEVIIDYPLQRRYAVSNFGRLISYEEGEEIRAGRLLKGSHSDGFSTLPYKTRIKGDPKYYSKQMFIHKLVAERFVDRAEEDEVHVVHIDHDRRNNHFSNLKWVTYRGRLDHLRTSPAVILAHKKLIELNIRSDGKKLTTTSVIRLKRMINDPNRKTRLKIIAKQFGISEMQLYRIKSGENWGHIKV